MSTFVNWLDFIRIFGPLIIGIITGYFLEIIKRRMSRSKALVRFDSKKDLILTPDNKDDLDSKAIYLRIKVMNTEKRIYAEKMKCSLMSVERKMNDNKWRLIQIGQLSI